MGTSSKDFPPLGGAYDLDSPCASLAVSQARMGTGERLADVREWWGSGVPAMRAQDLVHQATDLTPRGTARRQLPCEQVGTTDRAEAEAVAAWLTGKLGGGLVRAEADERYGGAVFGVSMVVDGAAVHAAAAAAAR